MIFTLMLSFLLLKGTSWSCSFSCCGIIIDFILKEVSVTFKPFGRNFVLVCFNCVLALSAFKFFLCLWFFPIIKTRNDLLPKQIQTNLNPQSQFLQALNRCGICLKCSMIQSTIESCQTFCLSSFLQLDLFSVATERMKSSRTLLKCLIIYVFCDNT